jgi:hypothetical protein
MLRNSFRFCAILSILTTGLDAQSPDRQLPSADEIVARMIERDSQRDAAFHGYVAARRYVLENSRHHKRAEMLVKVSCLENGSKRFETVSENGWGTARSHVFPRLLESENEASQPGARERSRITPGNYSFSIAGEESINERPAYVIEIAPRTQNKYLIKGRIWVDAEDYAIVRIEGTPAKNPSFWIKHVHFVHTYQKNGPLWLPATDRSETDARIIGTTELSIEYFDYDTAGPVLSALRESAERNVP